MWTAFLAVGLGAASTSLAHPAADAAVVKASARSAADAGTIEAIREEATKRSQVMRIEAGLADGFGSRLTGSAAFDRAAAWSVATLRANGASARIEDWGRFGLSWSQVGAAVEFEAPYDEVVQVQLAPWTPGTSGRVSGDAVVVPLVRNEEALARWSGRLRGKVVLYGEAPHFDPNQIPGLVLPTPLDVVHWSQGHDGSDGVEINRAGYRGLNFDERVARFFRTEGVLAVLRAGGERGALRVDETAMMGWRGYLQGKRSAIPTAVIASEAYGRAARLLAGGRTVRVGVDLRVLDGSGSVHGYNVIAEIPGSDPSVAGEVVMLGAHLDSWTAGTGAADDGAGAAVAMEAIRILKAVGARPRRTIRIGLWGGEEQGELGSLGYVKAHLGKIGFSSVPEAQAVPNSFSLIDSVKAGPGAQLFKAYFNMDHGAGRLLGLATRGNKAAASALATPVASLADLGFSAVSERTIGQTDSEFFSLMGVPTVDFYQPERDDESTHHTSLDALERVPEADLVQAATVAASMLYMVAQDDAPMRPDTFSKSLPPPSGQRQSGR